MSTIEVIEKFNEIQTLLDNCKDRLEIHCKDGEVMINKATLDFTYSGKFGNIVLSHVLTKRSNSNASEKLSILAAHMLLYSSKISGITTISY